jgi:hypothetical protein
MSNTNENISINIDDNFLPLYNNNDSIENELNTILKEINDESIGINSELYYNSLLESDIMTKSLDYHMNYNVKQLMLICDYYGLLREVKNNKFKKQEIIALIVDFEENIENTLVVYKRKQLWYFINELKNDKFMKKYILW